MTMGNVTFRLSHNAIDFVYYAMMKTLCDVTSNGCDQEYHSCVLLGSSVWSTRMLSIHRLLFISAFRPFASCLLSPEGDHGGVLHTF